MIAVYAGRFDPVTNGHLDILGRASRIFDQVIVAVYEASADRTLFPTTKRVEMVKASTQGIPMVDVEPFEGSLTDFVRQRGAHATVRGLRAVTDFSVEFDQALMYKDMAPEIEQVCLMSDLRFVFVRATRIPRGRGARPRRQPSCAPAGSSRAAGDLAGHAVADRRVRSPITSRPPEDPGSGRQVLGKLRYRFAAERIQVILTPIDAPKVHVSHVSEYRVLSMDVHCPTCRAAVSEWAARCPECGQPSGQIGSVRTAPRCLQIMATGRRKAQLTALVAGVVVAAFVLSAAWLSTMSHGSRHSSQLPNDLAGHLLVFALPGGVEIARTDGTVVRRIGIAGGVDFSRPIVTNDRFVVFANRGRAYRIGPGTSGPVKEIGDADDVFPTDGGGVGLQVGQRGVEQVTVAYVAPDGVVLDGTRPIELPPNTGPVARLITGLLVLDGSRHLRYLANGHSFDVGPVGSVLGTFTTTVAWTSYDNCQSKRPTSCQLHLTETVTGTDRLITAPLGTSGFSAGGAFSPDGRWLAAFAQLPTRTSVGLRLILIDTVTGRATAAGPVLTLGTAVGSAAWTLDSHWVFFSGTNGPMFAQRIGPAGPIGSLTGSPTSLRLPASFTFAPL